MRVVIVVDNRLRLASPSPLPESTRARLREAFTRPNPKHGDLERMRKSTRGVPRTLSTWEETRGVLSFPRGGLSRVREILRAEGHEVAYRDLRESGHPDAGLAIGDYARTPWAHQVAGADAAIAKTTCLVRSPTGSGKTSTILLAISRLKVPSLIVMGDRALLEQWQPRVASELGMHPNDVGLVEGAKRKLRPVTLAMQQTLHARGVDPEMNAYFGAVFVDEVHRFAAPTAYAAIDPFRARYRVGASADERRKDRLDFLIYDLCGEVAHETKIEDLVAAGLVHDVEIRVVPTEFRADWYGVPAASDFDDPVVKTVDPMRLYAEMKDDRERADLALRCVAKEFADCGRVAVFVHNRDHCLDVARSLTVAGIPNGFLIGGADYRKEFRSTRDRFQGGESCVGVGTYKAFGTGIDLPTLEAAVAVTPIASNRPFFGQVRGRLCRIAPGKQGARLYYLWDRHVFPRHLANLRSWNSRVVVAADSTLDRWVDSREWIKRNR